MQIAVDAASNHDAPTVGKPTEQTPDTFSIVDVTERVVELEVVNNILLPCQRNTDKEPITYYYHVREILTRSR